MNVDVALFFDSLAVESFILTQFVECRSHAGCCIRKCFIDNRPQDIADAVAVEIA